MSSAVKRNKSLSTSSMGVERDDNAKLKVCDKRRSFNLADRISPLPDDILVSILSFLTVEEAVATSSLSNRWKHLWKSITRLDFDATKAKTIMKMNRYLLDDERFKYVDWVTQVLWLHKCSTLDELKIRFDLPNDFCHFSRAIDWWINVAVSKSVRRLELDLSNLFQRHFLNYSFPSTLLFECPCNFNCSGVLLPFKFLESLYLKSVDVTEEDLHYFLYHCPFLERLSVNEAVNLRSLHVALAPSLKYLEIKDCWNCKTIEICNTDLVSFSYFGGNINMLLVNVPQLVEVSYEMVGIECMNHFFNQLSCCLSQLRTLTLFFPSCAREIRHFRPLQKLVKLKECILNICVARDESLLGYISWMEESPYLERFVLKLEREWELKRKTPNIIINRGESWRSVKSSHQYLKVVEMAGYYGGTSNFELAMYFIENAVALEKIIIDPHSQALREHQSDTFYEHAGRTSAHQQLEGKVPSEVKLIIL